MSIGHTKLFITYSNHGNAKQIRLDLYELGNFTEIRNLSRVRINDFSYKV